MKSKLRLLRADCHAHGALLSTRRGVAYLPYGRPHPLLRSGTRPAGETLQTSAPPAPPVTLGSIWDQVTIRKAVVA